MPGKRSAGPALWREAPDLDPVHDPGVEPLTALLAGPGIRAFRRGESVIRVGTASWTDPTMTAPGVFYPASATTPEARLRFYASRFPIVEVDSTYYALPSRRMAELWDERTPDDFVFNIKAHALMTGQPSEVNRLPRELRDTLPRALAGRSRVYAKDLPGEIVDHVWKWFLDALAPLRDAGKLGAVLLQFPRWVIPTRESRDVIADAVRRLGDVRSAVELRNHRWFSDERQSRERTLEWFRREKVALVMVDGPQGLESSVPALELATEGGLQMIRLHGRRAATWEKQGVPTVERYRWFYTKDELAEWVPRIIEAVRHPGEVHVLLNNCYGNYGAANAIQLGNMLERAL